MNPLDSFTVERLEELADENTLSNMSFDELLSLAKIALAAKQAKPVASFILVDGEYQQLAEKYRESPDAITLYDTAPAPPDGWVLVPKEFTVDMYNAWVDCRLGLHEEWAAMLATAPKPE